MERRDEYWMKREKNTKSRKKKPFPSENISPCGGLSSRGGATNQIDE
jgi:hypothetical protein